jgi:alkylated DNA repair dioxygenase AlkB
MLEPEDGRLAIERSGFSYLPRFINQEEALELIDYFGGLLPIWEQRHRGEDHGRSSGHGRRLTRPVYWLGAWQFACLGYYAEPDHRKDRCLRGERLPAVMQQILERLRPVLEDSHAAGEPEEANLLPNTCLINYYGREVGLGVPRDYARLRMHRDGEPGPVVMFNIGQAGLLEFLDPDRSPDPELRLWTRHRSVTILSGPEFKDRLYHRVIQVRTGDQPELRSKLDHFEVRRVSVSFRSVPEELISDFGELPLERRERVREYVEELALSSEHYREQLRTPAAAKS